MRPAGEPVARTTGPRMRPFLEIGRKLRVSPPDRRAWPLGPPFATRAFVMTESRPVAVAALLAAGVQPHPHEAVAIVLQLCGQISRRGPVQRVTPAISTSTVSIDASGAVTVSGGEPGEDEQTVSLAGRLLVELLDHSAAALESAALPRLRATALRAASSGRAAFGSASQLGSALRRYGPKYGEAQAVRALFERWAAPRVWPTAPERRPAAPTPNVERRSRSSTRFSASAAWSRAARALLVGTMLLLLAGAGAVFLNGGRVSDLPVAAPISRPTPAQPRRQPAWELLRGSERVVVNQAPRARSARQAGVSERSELTVPPPETAVPDR